MEEDMKLLNARLSGAQEDREQAAQAAARLEAELEELKARPVEVAVETVVDQEAIEKARAEAVAEMRDKLNKAREAKEAAEARRKNAEEALEQIRLQLEEQARAEKRPRWGRIRIWPSLSCYLTRPRKRSTGCTGSCSRCRAGTRTPPAG